MATRMVRRTLTTGMLALGLTLSGCGEVLGDGAEDEVLLDVEGTFVSSAALDEARAKKLRAALIWERYPESTLECLKNLPPGGNNRRCFSLDTPYEYTRETMDVKIHSRSPTTVRLPVNKLPPANVLNGEPGSRLGLASVVVYVDENGNGQLDTISPTATSRIDTVIGYQEGHTAESLEFHWIVYREGALHPLHQKLASCPEPPQGYSVATYQYSNGPEGEGQVFDGCFVKRGRVSLNMIVNPDHQSFPQLACEQYHAMPASEQAPATPPAASTTSFCSTSFDVEGEALTVNEHPELFCRGGNLRRYALHDIFYGRWDDRANPPAWWPCEVTPAPETEEP
ncbi:hypothetical protein [Pyxidicoccus xibeiensis]|uniref:hypothetical protein n=1 Tax=Pyxidicoccus xibeiensis TaxID=2906759 RepID=UPI0020A78D13|nr:hypothetical protein [Pyxidicoccus xibeiensis]MCP3144295.1 hypothetical protein [Pyxidicoccus xibeiensis]